MIPALFFKCATCVLPAFVGSVATTPSINIADIAVVKSASSGSMFGSIVDASREFRFDEKSVLTFSCTFLTLASTNWFVDDRFKTLSGVVVNTGLSMWKDSVLMGGSLSNTTRFLFVLRDVVSIIPSISHPGLNFVAKTCLVFFSQVPCTLLNTLAMDRHIFNDARGRRTRIRRSFCSSFLVRFLKSVFGSTLACQINYGVMKRMLLTSLYAA